LNLLRQPDYISKELNYKNMAFRTVAINNHSKIEYGLNYLVFRTAEETKRILLDEIHTVIVQSTQVNVSSALLVELAKRKIKVVFCDEKNNPFVETVSLYGDSISPRRIKQQINWDESFCHQLWALIVKEKIYQQSLIMRYKNFDQITIQLQEYIDEVVDDDQTNREGHAAKVYFNNLFDKNFTRDKDCFENASLNYGYSIIMSQISREIVAQGYLTQLGIHHKNEFNHFNLSCDLMEPFRPIVDKMTLILKDDEDFKKAMVKLLNIKVFIDGIETSLENAIHIYVLSIFNSIENKDLSKVRFFSGYEL